MTTADQHAARRLILSLRRFDRAVSSIIRTDKERESYRADTLKKMAGLLEEFGLTDAAAIVAQTIPQFDGRHLET